MHGNAYTTHKVHLLYNLQKIAMIIKHKVLWYLAVSKLHITHVIQHDTICSELTCIQKLTELSELNLML